MNTWSGTWVAERLGVELAGGERLRGMLGLALRRNPKRAHLLVSNVLGKHVPQAPSVVYGHGVGLGRRVRELLGDAEAARAVVLGYAETATGLGHSVADGLGAAPYLHSTPAGRRCRHRRRFRGVPLARHLPPAAAGGPVPAGRGRAAGAGRRRVLDGEHGAEHRARSSCAVSAGAVRRRRPGRHAVGGRRRAARGVRLGDRGADRPGDGRVGDGAVARRRPGEGAGAGGGVRGCHRW